MQGGRGLGRVGQVDIGNGEFSQGGMPYEMPMEVEDYPVGAFKVNIDVNARVSNTEENMVIVEEKLGGDNISLSDEGRRCGHFLQGRKTCQVL